MRSTNTQVHTTVMQYTKTLLQYMKTYKRPRLHLHAGVRAHTYAGTRHGMQCRCASGKERAKKKKPPLISEAEFRLDGKRGNCFVTLSWH